MGNGCTMSIDLIILVIIVFHFEKKYVSWKNDCRIHGYNNFLCTTSEYDGAICLLIDLKHNLLILVQPIFNDQSKSDHNSVFSPKLQISRQGSMLHHSDTFYQCISQFQYQMQLFSLLMRCLLKTFILTSPPPILGGYYNSYFFRGHPEKFRTSIRISSNFIFHLFM